MSNFRHRNSSQIENLVTTYENLVESLSSGYNMSIYEYVNDLSCRQHLEEKRHDPATQALWQRVESADAHLRKILLPTRSCIQGSYPPGHFWYWGYPPNSPELEADLMNLDLL